MESQSANIESMVATYREAIDSTQKVVAKDSDRLATQANSLLASHDLTSAKILKNIPQNHIKTDIIVSTFIIAVTIA